MSFEVVACSAEQRSFFREFQIYLYRNLNCLNKIQNFHLGKNFSYIIVRKNETNHIVLFDVDDGSGITFCTPGNFDGDCKLNFESLNFLKQKYEIQKTIVLKLQLNPSDCEFYPFKENLYPAGYFCDGQNNISPSTKSVEKDIDVLWMGSVLSGCNPENFEIYDKFGTAPSNWPKGKDIKLWPQGRRITGYRKLKEIEQKRKDLKIICSTSKIPFGQYISYVERAKICLELPGCGWWTKRLVENIKKGKCILSLKQKQKLHFEYVPNEHYAVIEDEDFLDLEEKIDSLLNNSSLIEDYEKQSLIVSKFFDYQYMLNHSIKTIDQSI